MISSISKANVFTPSFEVGIWWLIISLEIISLSSFCWDWGDFRHAVKSAKRIHCAIVPNELEWEFIYFRWRSCVVGQPRSQSFSVRTRRERGWWLVEFWGVVLLIHVTIWLWSDKYVGGLTTKFSIVWVRSWTLVPFLLWNVGFPNESPRVYHLIKILRLQYKRRIS
jgi:hypothetical protein